VSGSVVGIGHAGARIGHGIERGHLRLFQPEAEDVEVLGLPGRIG